VKESRLLITVYVTADNSQTIRLPVHVRESRLPFEYMDHVRIGPIAANEPHLTVGKERRQRAFLGQEGDLPAVRRPTQLSNAELTGFPEQMAWL